MIAPQLLRRLLFVQITTHVLSFLLSAVFGSRVLLLEDQAAAASRVEIVVMGACSATLASIFTVVVLRRMRALLGALGGSDAAGTSRARSSSRSRRSCRCFARRRSTVTRSSRSSSSS